MNLTDMLALVRQDLHDEDATNYRWTDDDITRHIARAVQEFSKDVPCEVKDTLTLIAPGREIDISALTNRVCILAAEWPVEEYPPRYCRFSLFGDTVTLLTEEIPLNGESVNVYYGKVHTLNTTSTIPAALENSVALGAEAFALLEYAAFNINRVSLGGKMTVAECENEGYKRYDQWRKELKRASYRNRVRAGRLYLPERPPVGETRDYGP